jgi:hypothetical protein
MGFRKITILLLFLTIVFLIIPGCIGWGPSPPPIYTPEPCNDLCGTARFYVTATESTEGVTSIMVTISYIRLFRYQEGQWSVKSRKYTDITNNTYTFDLLQINDTELLLGSSQQRDGYYTEVVFSVDKAEVTLSDGRQLETKLPVLPGLPPFGRDTIMRDFSARCLFRIITGETTELVIHFDADKSVRFSQDGGVLFKPVTELEIRPADFIYEVPQDSS